MRNDTCWDYLRAFPPISVRLAARRKITVSSVLALSNRELAIRTNIPLSRIIEISESFSWDDVTISEAERFCEACEFDPTIYAHRERQMTLISRCLKTQVNRAPRFLRKSPSWPTEFMPLLKRLQQYQALLRGSNQRPTNALS